MTINERMAQQQAAIRAALAQHFETGENALHAAIGSRIAMLRFLACLFLAAVPGAMLVALLFGRHVTFLSWLVWLAVTVPVGTVLSTWVRAVKQYLVGVTDRRLVIVLLKPQRWKVNFSDGESVKAYPLAKLPPIKVKRRALKMSVELQGNGESVRFDIAAAGPFRAEAEAIAAAISGGRASA